MDDQKIYSKAGVLVLDGTGVEYTTYQAVKRMHTLDQQSLNAKDRQLVEERMKIESLTKENLFLKFRLIKRMDKISKLEAQVASLSEERDRINQRLEDVNNANTCIFCYTNEIDCVFTPCGHQISCLQCSHRMKNCPMCNRRSKLIRIFGP